MRTCSTCGGSNAEDARFCSACGSALTTEAPASRRRISAVFCDLVGSTELTERMDAETVQGVMARYWAAMREVVERHGGHVEKFIGDAVVAVFGMPALHEDDALRAARTAAEMREAIAPLNDELAANWGVRIQIRTGVATGEVLASARPGEPSVMGSVLNLAARLQSAAGPGETLVDVATWRLIRTRAEGEPSQPLALKGFETPTRPIRLVRVLGAGGDGRAEPPFVGRETELALLRHLREDTRRRRRCRVVTVTGDAGIGKTRLVREFVARGAADDAVLLGRCRSYGEGVALGPIGDALLETLDAETSDDPVGAVESLLAGRDDARSIATAFCAAVGRAEGAVTPDEALSAVRVTLATLARQRPVVLILDDLQWAEAALLTCVRHVEEWTRDAPMLVVCLARPDLLDEHPTWGRGAGELAIRLDPLTEDEGRALAAALEAASDQIDRLVATAGGNPFFLEEIVASLREDDGARDTVPPTISALLGARIDRLPLEEQEALRSAAVLGTSFDIETLGRLSATGDGGGLDRIVDALVRRDFLIKTERAGRYRFRHELTREAAYGALPKSRRAELHERAADVLERADPETDVVIGRHLERARGYLLELGPARAAQATALGERAAEHLARAGRAAAARGDVTTTAADLERAAALLPPGHPARGPILADLHDALMYAGDTERAGTTVAELLEEIGPSATGSVAERARMQHAFLLLLEDPNAVPLEATRAMFDLAIEGLESAGDRANLATAYANRSVIGWLEGSAASMEADAERALALAKESGNWRAMADAAGTLGAALLRGPVPLDEVERRLGRLVEELSGDRLTQAAVRLDLANTLTLRGLLDRAEAEAQTARDTLQELGQRRWLIRCSEIFADVARRRGDAEGAVRLHRTVHAAYLEQRDEVNARLASIGLASALLDAGADEEADAIAADVEREGSREDLETQVVWRSVRARAAARRGDADLALRLAREATDMADSTDWLLLRAETQEEVAQVLTALGRPDAAEARAEAAELYRRKGAVTDLGG